MSSWLSRGASIIPLVYAWHNHLPPFVLGDYCPFPLGKCTTSFHAGLWGLPSCQRAVCRKPAQSDFLMLVRLHRQSASFREYHLDETQFLLYPFQRQCTGPAHTLLAEMHRVSPVPTSHCVWPFSFNSHPGSHGVCYQCLLWQITTDLVAQSKTNILEDSSVGQKSLMDLNGLKSRRGQGHAPLWRLFPSSKTMTAMVGCSYSSRVTRLSPSLKPAMDLTPSHILTLRTHLLSPSSLFRVLVIILGLSDKPG